MNIRRRLLGLAFVDEFAPFVVLFTLWFDDNGVTIEQLSAAFAAWTIIAIAAEVPGGVVADRMDRRHLLGAAFATRAAGIAIWLVWPTFAGLVVGAILWALHDAAASGSWEALIHDQLVAVDDEASYARLMARIGQASHIGLAMAALLSTPLLGAGLSLTTLGWITVAAHGPTIAIVLTLPNVAWVVARSRERSRAAAITAETVSGASPRGAVHRALADRDVRILAGVAAGLGGLAIFDDFVALIARDRGASDAITPIVFLTVWVGLVVGGEIAARRPDIGPRTLSAVIVLGGILSLAGLAADAIWALAGIGVAYCALQATWVISDARLQSRVEAHVRATVSSVRELGVGLMFSAALATVALMSHGDDPTPGLMVCAGVLLVIGVAARALPRS